MQDFDISSINIAKWLWTERRDVTESTVAFMVEGLPPEPWSIIDRAQNAACYQSAIVALSAFVVQELQDRLHPSLADGMGDIVIDVNWPVVLTMLLEEFARVRKSESFKQN